MAVPLTNTDGSFMIQLIGIASIGAFVAVSSAVVWLLLKFTIGLRPTEEQEIAGLDISEIGVEAYPEFGHGSQKF